MRQYALILFAVLFIALPKAFGQQTSPTPADRTMLAMIRLTNLGYWTDLIHPKNDANRQAIVAFQKVERLPRTGKLTDQFVQTILQANAPLAKDSTHSHHVEVDLNRQVLFVVGANDSVERILVVSTGNGKYFETPDKGGRYALTPRGEFKVFYKIVGWRKSPLGMLFDPMYIKSGVAIHGAQQVPSQPASHGCIRIPMFAADRMLRITPIGTPVIVYGENPKPRKE